MIRSLVMGGAEHHVVKLCQMARPSEVELSVFLLVNDEPSDWLPEMPPHIPVHISPFSRHDVRVIKWLGDSLRKQRSQVVHSFLWSADAIASLSTILFARVPLVCSERGDRGYGGHYSAGGLLGKYDKWVTFRAANCFCAASHFGGRLLQQRGYRKEKIQVIHNGVQLDSIDLAPAIDLREMLGWAPERPIVGVACSLIKRKAVDGLLRAVSTIPEARAPYCAVVGDGPEREGLEGLVGELGISHRVAFLGQHTPADAFVKGFDIAVLNTNQPTEVCSNSILEYMACAKPVVATRIAGNPELVLHGETGLLIEPDSPQQLAEAIQRLADSPAERQTMGAAGRRRVEREFNMETVTARYIALWRAVACGHKCLSSADQARTSGQLSAHQAGLPTQLPPA